MCVCGGGGSDVRGATGSWRASALSIAVFRNVAVVSASVVVGRDCVGIPGQGEGWHVQGVALR